MKRLLVSGAVAALLAAAAPAAFAQMGPGGGMPGPFARLGPPQSIGPFSGNYGMHGGSPYGTSAWMLTREEFREHLQRMLQLSTYAECMAYMSEHHAFLQQRARDRGQVWSPGNYTPICDYFRD